MWVQNGLETGFWNSRRLFCLLSDKNLISGNLIEKLVLNAEFIPKPFRETNKR